MIEAVAITLAMAFAAVTYVYRALLVDAERRCDELSKANDALRARERRYYEAHEKARTP